jgi:hypothetical protein
VEFLDFVFLVFRERFRKPTALGMAALIALPRRAPISMG